ncbi:MAG TPA: hypothetical protein VGO11_08850 [Chthoniobacteraceae bacterium]|jgi:hypothetical protein|nr:hypothetical protein [Chthoniobacteraceae bacterium]
MKTRPLLLLLLLLLLLASGARADSVIVVVSAGGTPEYTSTFAEWAGRWQKAASAARAHATMLGLDPAQTNVREALRDALAKETPAGVEPLWLVLLGHGTWDGQSGKFNVAGDDVSIADLHEWLAPVQRPLVLVAGFSASGAFLKPLAGPERIIVTATRAGSEENFARFGGYFSAAIGDPSADLDKDGEVSVLEAWLTASRKVADFYKDEGRLATEHSLLEDNGDGLGTPPDFFEGVRAVKKPKAGAADGLRARQIHLVHSAQESALPAETRARRDALEQEVARLREQKAELPEKEYYAELEKLMLQIAALYEAAK